MKDKLASICREFAVKGDFIDALPYGTGHINDTYLMHCTKETYILQRLNTGIFRQPEKLMENFRRVTAHIAEKIDAEKRRGSTRRRETLHLVFANSGRPYFRDAEDGFWRCYVFVDRAVTYDVIESTRQAEMGAAAFGEFQSDLADLPGRLHETIPDFHNTPKRLAALKEAIKADKCGRLKKVSREVDFMLAHEADCGKLLKLQESGDIHERITHNDTKLNNVLIDKTSGDGICVIDLDTTMPGLPHYDFGDMLRTGTSPAAEDERDLEKVGMRFEMFDALLRGYLSTAGAVLNPLEKSLLPFAGVLLTLETGIRFLTDYLDGDVYFKIHRPGHNLDRCRTQIKLVQSMEEQMTAMQRRCDELSR
jgi:hypothetical protein